MKVVGVTACPTGVAHTYMSAEALVLAGEKYGIDVKIETQGTAGIENNLTEEDIKEAACVILSTDVAIQGEERFHGKKVMRMGVQDLMKKAEPIMKKIKDTPEAPEQEQVSELWGVAERPERAAFLSGPTAPCH